MKRSCIICLQIKIGLPVREFLFRTGERDGLAVLAEYQEMTAAYDSIALSGAGKRTHTEALPGIGKLAQVEMMQDAIYHKAHF